MLHEFWLTKWLLNLHSRETKTSKSWCAIVTRVFHCVVWILATFGNEHFHGQNGQRGKAFCGNKKFSFVRHDMRRLSQIYSWGIVSSRNKMSGVIRACSKKGKMRKPCSVDIDSDFSRELCFYLCCEVILFLDWPHGKGEKVKNCCVQLQIWTLLISSHYFMTAEHWNQVPTLKS